ncbi:elongator complex protein 1 isoform X1 [Lactuca sativa]|uniref:elongator complex protein 1 isoform X1 n=1 Tax=Lactuca sativa TaxID=4236 RepID=UPI000CD8C796|nr:elongator complex protein 1 isoform X1 [Lactuca sativa]
MKNLKLSWELSSNLQLQSENEVIRCTAFDIEQNRFFFASSANFIYTTHLPSSQIEESWGKPSSNPLVEAIDLDPDDSITSLEYLMEKEALIIGTSSGVLLLYNVDDNVTEVVGKVEGGVKSLSPSPDGDLLCIITGLGQMLVMTHDWDLLYEITLEDPIEDADTLSGDRILDSECSATWRGDGKFFATITSSNNSSHKKLKIWERETGNLHSVSEPKSFMGEIVEWMPSGAKIATVCDQKEENKSPSIVFFERNGLKRSSFSVNSGLDTITTVKNLKWNCNSDLLAAIVRKESHDSIKIWSFSNNHWYLKQEISHSRHDGVKFMWDPVNPLRLISWNLKGMIMVYNFIWITAVTDNSVALVIDGSKILVTPLSISLFPPPMCLFELEFPSSVREMAFWSFKNRLAASLSDGSLSVVELPDIDTWQDLEGKVFRVELTILENPTPFLHLTWLDSHVLLGVAPNGNLLELEIMCSEDHIHGSVACSGWDAKNSNIFSLERNVIAIASNPVKKRSAFIQLNGGNVFEYTSGLSLQENNHLRFSQSCPWMSVASIGDFGVLESFLLFGLDNNSKLHVNQNVISNNCHSFSLYSNSQNQEMTHLILLTKQDFLFVIDIRDIVLGQTEVKYGNFVPVITRRKDEEGKKFIQIWEKGSKILGVVHGDESSVIIQTTRGNLESIYPRKLVLESIVNALVQERFRDSLHMVRRHRIDFNVIVDHGGWENFVKLATEFVIQADNLNYITEFVCSLKNENVMETLYKSYITNEANAKESRNVDSNNKVNSVLLAIRKALESKVPETPERELCILTTLAKSDPPFLEEALERVKKIREMELSDSTDPKRQNYPSSEESLKHLLWLSESESLFEAALGLYDLNLAAIVALNSQQDPKEFLPFLQELELLPGGIMRYKIDLRLQRHEKALQHIFHAGDSYFQDFINLIINNPQLFPHALQLVTDPIKRNQVLEAWGDYLTNIKSFEDAATTYLCCCNLQKALKAYRASYNWTGVLTVAGLLKLKKDEITLLANELCEELQTIGKPSEAAKIALDYIGDFKSGINLLISAREWEEALRVALMDRREELVADVATGAVDCAATLVAEYEEGAEKVGKYLARYLAVRQRRLVLAAKIQAEERSVNELDDDAVSEASSSFSGMSAYTTGSRKDSAASMISSSTSKRGQRRQKKKGKIRAGSPDEEMALVEHLKGMSLTAGAARELKSLLGCLVMIGKEDVARKLQRVAENFQLSQTAAVKIASDAMTCESVDEHTFVLEVYLKKLRKDLLQSEEFSWQSKVFVAP